MITLIRPECPKPEALEKEIYDDPVNKEALRKASYVNVCIASQKWNLSVTLI